MSELSPQGRGKYLLNIIWLGNLLLVAAVGACLLLAGAEKKEASLAEGSEIPDSLSEEKVEEIAQVNMMGMVPTSSKKAALVVVIDDVGNDLSQLAALEKFSYPLALAFLPDAPHFAAFDKLAQERDWITMGHIPMEPLDLEEIDHPACLTSDRSSADINLELGKMVAGLGGISGLDNHQGAKLTENSRVMDDVAAFCRRNNLFVLDNKISGSSQFYKRAKQAGLAVFRRDIFLDGDGTSGTEEAVAAQIVYAQTMAIREERPIIVVAHARPDTLKALENIASIIDLNKSPIMGIEQLL